MWTGQNNGGRRGFWMVGALDRVVWVLALAGIILLCLAGRLAVGCQVIRELVRGR